MNISENIFHAFFSDVITANNTIQKVSVLINHIHSFLIICVLLYYGIVYSRKDAAYTSNVFIGV